MCPIGIYSFEEIIGYQMYAKYKCLKVQQVGKNMPFLVIIMVWLDEHRAFVVEYFIKTESSVAAQPVFCKKIKLKRQNLVPQHVAISKWVKTFWERIAATSIMVVGRMGSVQTVENCKKMRS